MTNYSYKATVVNVIDGDTVELDIDLGFYTTIRKQVIRLARINAPELKTEEGVKAKEYLETLLAGKELVIYTKKNTKGKRKGEEFKEKWRRFLAEIYVGEVNVSDNMLEAGLAKKY